MTLTATLFMMIEAMMFDGTNIAPAMPHGPQLITGSIDHHDYPREALIRGIQGRVEMLLMIDESGLVSSCTIRQSSGYMLLDETSCQIASTRYRFEPARNAEGQPMAAQIRWPVEWKLDTK